MSDPQMTRIDTIATGPLPGATVSLHPNLARVAATYQRICERFARGELDSVSAGVEIRELVARDDEGVQWTINPRDGGWLYLSKMGSWAPGVPPTSGLATLTPHDVSTGASGAKRYNPDDDITWAKADDDAGDGLRGVTRRSAYQPPREIRRPRWLYPTVAALAVCVAIVLALAALSIARGVEDTPGGAPSTTLPGLSAADPPGA